MAEKIEGVFLLEKKATIGTGHTQKHVEQKIFCIARETEEDVIEVRYLGADDKPLETSEKIPKRAFVRDFTFQPYYFENKQAEKKKKANKHIAVAEEHARRNELFSAEYEFKNALNLDEENLRANFGIGNVYLRMGEKEKAQEIFKKLSHIDAIFEETNKHLFNECGIQLRKQQLCREAIDYYKKALDLSPEDENLFFNLARAHYENGDTEKARETVYRALAIQPEFKEGKALLEYIAKHDAKDRQ